jgi:hypothetical protein
LQVDGQITYGTFDWLCENAINKRVKIRNAVNNYFIHGSASNDIKDASKKLQALIIDEVDVFFSKEYYGMQYCPVTLVNDMNIN